MSLAPTIDAQAVEADTPALDPTPILTIHRGDPDGFVGFKAKSDKGLWPVGAVKVRDVREMLPSILSHFCSYDGYFSVNSFYGAGSTIRKTGLPYFLGKEKNVLELSACYADIDVGRPEQTGPASMSWENARIEALRRQRDGIIPPFSMMACSGRGLYLFWLLRDTDSPDRLPKAHQSSIIHYKRINKALHDRLYGMACDTIKDASRVLRLPGSIHTTVMKRVTYSLTIQGDEGSPIVYTIPELQRLLDIKALEQTFPVEVRDKARPVHYTRTVKRGSQPKRRVGFNRLNAQRAQDLSTIEAWREGWLHAGQAFQDGHISVGRGKMLRLYADYLRASGVDKDMVTEAVTIMARNCHPPYPSDKSDSTLEGIMSDTYSSNPNKHFKNIRTERLLGWLGINEHTDPELLARLVTLVPASIKEARIERTPSQADYTRERRQGIEHIVHLRQGKIPPTAKMATLLASFNVVNPVTQKPWSSEVIRKDYKFLGYPKPPRGRPRKSDA